jgi:hypothetical protein
MSRDVTPARALAVELRSLWVDAQQGRINNLVDVLERIARAADQYAEHVERGVPQLDPEAFTRRHTGTSFRC